MITWNPDHRRQANAKAKHLSPFWITVVTTILNWGVLDEIKYKDGKHKKGCNGDPTDEPVVIDSESNHEFNTIVHFLGTENPTNSNGLEEDTPIPEKL